MHGGDAATDGQPCAQSCERERHACAGESGRRVCDIERALMCERQRRTSEIKRYRVVECAGGSEGDDVRLPPEHNRAGKGVDQQCSSGGRRIGRRRHCARALEEGEHVYVDLERGGGGGDEAQDGLEGVEGAGELGQVRLGADGDGARVSGGGRGGLHRQRSGVRRVGAEHGTCWDSHSNESARARAALCSQPLKNNARIRKINSITRTRTTKYHHQQQHHQKEQKQQNQQSQQQLRTCPTLCKISSSRRNSTAHADGCAVAAVLQLPSLRPLQLLWLILTQPPLFSPLLPPPPSRRLPPLQVEVEGSGA